MNVKQSMLRLVRHPKLLVTSLVGLLVLIGLVWLGVAVWHKPPAKPAGSLGPPATAVVEITPTGFLPQTIAVSPNTEVIWVNEDVMPHLPAADPYPSHSELPNLVAPRALGQQETYSFLFTKKGTVHYHDDLRPTLTGVVEVR